MSDFEYLFEISDFYQFVLATIDAHKHSEVKPLVRNRKRITLTVLDNIITLDNYNKRGAKVLSMVSIKKSEVDKIKVSKWLLKYMYEDLTPNHREKLFDMFMSADRGK